MTSSVTLNTMADTAPDYETTLAGNGEPPQAANDIDEKDILAKWKEQESGALPSSSTEVKHERMSRRGSGGGIKRIKKKNANRSMSPNRSEKPASDRPRRRSSRDGSMAINIGLTRSELKEARVKQQEEEEQQQQQQMSIPEEASPNNSRAKLLESTATTEVHLLDFASLKQLHGRSSEVKELTGAIDRTFYEDAPSEVVLILGGSGTGKTSVVHHTLTEYKARSFCVEGKFDQNDTNVSRPYAAFLEVFRDLNKQILAHKEKDQFVERIQSALGAEAFRVTKLIPSLIDVIGEISEDDDDGDDTFRDRASLKQIFRLTREMMRQICSAGYPVIIFLDDLQWGGKESLALFQNLANDVRLKNLLLIGTYRDEEIAPLSIMLEEIGDLQSTLIRLSPLDDEWVNIMVADVLKMDPATTKKFSSLVYRKTGGNALFVCHFLDRMQEVSYLQFSVQLGRWGWDLVKIRSEVNANDEIHETLVYRLEFLPSTARVVLQRAASLGNKFDLDILVKTLDWDRSVDREADKANDERATLSPIYMKALEGVSGEAKITTDISVIAQALVKLGFLHHLHGSTYRFAHDKIHYAALSLIPEGRSRQTVHWSNGQVLKRLLDESDDHGDGLFFALVEQLNQGSPCIPDDEERLELAALNLRASYKVKETSAFYPAAGYAKEGLFLLARVEHKWDFYKGLTTKLILVMAEMAMCCGQSKDCMSATQEIIRNSRNLEEKVPAYLLRLKNLGQVGKFKEAVKEGLEVLNLLGESFPKESNLALVAFQLAKSKSDGFGKTDDDFCDLKLMTDEKQQMIMKILAITAFYAVRGTDKTQGFVPLIFFRMFQITSRYGLTNQSIVAFAGYGVLLASILKEYSEGFRFGRLAMDLQSGLGHRNLARGSLMNYQFLHHLKEPLADTLEPLMEGFKAGMICDETADAVNALSVYCSHYLNVGLPLEPLKQEYKGYLALMLELERDRVWQITIPYAQLIDNLMGKNQQPSVLSGDMMNLKMVIDKVKKAENLNAVRSIYACRLEAAYWFASYDMALRMIQHLKELKLCIGQSLIFNYRREVFFTGMTYLALAKNTKKNRQHIWSARDCIAKMKTWATKGSADCEDLLFIMHAELYAVVGRKTPEEIAVAYQIAVTNSHRVGSLQNLALATELAGSYYISAGEHATASSFLQQSYDAYNEWNAYKKASHLEVLYPQMFSKLVALSTTNPR